MRGRDERWFTGWGRTVESFCFEEADFRSGECCGRGLAYGWRKFPWGSLSD